jgi:hypothetical protein
VTQELTTMFPFMTAPIEEPKISLEAAVTGAIDAVLQSLGNRVKEAIYSHMENAYGLQKEDIPCKIQKFSETLQQIFGPLSKLIETKIIEKLHSTYEGFFYISEEEDLSLAEFIHSLELYLKSEI